MADVPAASDHEKIARLYETANMFDEAQQELEHAVSLSTNTQHSLNMKVHQAELYMRANQYDLALGHLKELKQLSDLDQQQRANVNDQIFRIYKRQGLLSELDIEVSK